ncbi:HoxN/HupN/NixA family nickel/cobalt transporter (plasmid) [Hafnia alvei]|uniref:HoxN/HupN/NixA family nickel/cobalt transporter n=1 Tax=Hafnia alvei TaxID=569 RepID=UPI000C9FC353|nr:HoxN/HupN/NixA family nickel/cobalt transporter [Hafnia alvei]PNL03908.1 HoxN/HupN/NixA family nickel/cobalt transporter [Hafnia alvei]
MNTIRNKGFLLLILLLIVNAIAWIFAFIEFGQNTVLMGMAFLAYSFGLRHAVDADHIAAIDNVTRKLMQQGKTPVSVGAYFSLGHSTIVILASFAIAATATTFKSDFDWFHHFGGTIGIIVSAAFLLLFSVINFVIFVSVYRQFCQIKRGGGVKDSITQILDNNGGILVRIFKSTFNMVNKSWHMYFVGFLFGLGFDTATEISLLGISAASATHGINMWSIMIFPVLFATGMVLIDSLDNFVMIGAYGWAFSKPIKKLYYNMTITGISVLIALFIGGIETLGLLADKLDLNGGGWMYINKINDNFGSIGYLVIGLFILCWLMSGINYYIRGYDKIIID